MSRKMKSIISAVTGITTVIGITPSLPISSFNTHSSEIILQDRISASCDAVVSYSLPDFTDFIGQ